MTKKYLILLIPLLAGVLVAGNNSPTDSPIKQIISGPVDHTGTVFVYKNGELMAKQENVLMEGEDAIREELTTGTDVGTWDMITVGNGSAPTTSSASLDSEWSSCGLSPATGTITDETEEGNWNLTHTFDITCDDIIINTTAQYSSGASTSYDYYSGTDFGRDINAYSGDTLEIVWQNDVDSA